LRRFWYASGWLLAGLVVWAAAMPAAMAHESRPAYLEIDETAPGQYSMVWRTPVKSGRRLPVVLQVPDGARNLQDPVIMELADSRLERRRIDAGPEGLSGKRIEFPGLQFTITDVVVKVKLLDGRSWMVIARPSEPWVTIEPARGITAVAFDFLKQGIEHILSGADHLLFVFGLLLLVRRPWSLVKTITAFTVAHSLTLAAATLGYVRPPAAPIEAAIALSIVFLGVEIVRARRGDTSLAIRHPWVVAFAFGLLHGFGFASALSAAGLPPADVPLALVSFNVGVEIGQLAFVALVLLVARGLRQLWVMWPRPAELLPAYVVGSLGAFWLVQRLATI
jgi:hydrogenase/urease accessory protein HupE